MWLVRLFFAFYHKYKAYSDVENFSQHLLLQTIYSDILPTWVVLSWLVLLTDQLIYLLSCFNPSTILKVFHVLVLPRI